MFQGCGRPKLKKMKRSISPKLQGVQVLHAQSPVEADTLDIDATLDEAIVLRERRAAEPGSQDASGQQSQEQGVGKGGNGGGMEAAAAVVATTGGSNNDASSSSRDASSRATETTTTTTKTRVAAVDGSPFWTGLCGTYASG